MPRPTDLVTDFASTEIYTLTSDTGAESARRMAADADARHLLVLQDGVLKGVVSPSDLRRARRAQAVAEIMSSPVLCINPETSVSEALQIMADHRVSYLPIVAGSFLVGAVTREVLTGAPKPSYAGSPVGLPN